MKFLDKGIQQHIQFLSMVRCSCQRQIIRCCHK